VINKKNKKSFSLFLCCHRFNEPRATNRKSIWYDHQIQ